MTLKKLLTGIALLLALMWLSGELLLRSDERAAQKQGAVIATSSTSEVRGAATSSQELASTPAKEALLPLSAPRAASSSVVTVPQVPLVAALPVDDKETMNVTLAVEGKSFVHQIPKGESVAALLVAAQSAGEITFQGKDYSGLGMLIVGMNGKANNMDKSNLYWIYSVNGQKATKGVSEYILSPNDVVSWSYEQNTY